MLGHDCWVSEMEYLMASENPVHSRGAGKDMVGGLEPHITDMAGFDLKFCDNLVRI